MAEILSVYSFPGRGRPAYPAAWLDGRIWRLKGGQDFTSSPHSVRSSLSRRSSKLGGKCQTHIVGDDLIFQYLPPGGSPVPGR